MNFPTLVYRTPGAHQCPGGTYAYAGAASPEILERMLAGGWFETLQEALSGEVAVVGAIAAEELEDPLQTPGIDATPISASAIVRAWLSEKLNAVGIEHDQEMHEDELLFLICHEFAKPVAGSVEEIVPPAIDPILPVDNLPVDDLDSAPPTREELEAKAKELSISFDGRTTDRLLGEKIAFVLAERE